MTTSIYLLCTEFRLDDRQQVSEDVMRYTASEFEEVFSVEECTALRHGYHVERSQRGGVTKTVFVDMLRAARKLTAF